jgi:hypothetical protein
MRPLSIIIQLYHGSQIHCTGDCLIEVRAGLTVFVLCDFYHLLAISCQPDLVLKESRVCEKDYLGLIQVDLSSLVKLSRLYHISTQKSHKTNTVKPALTSIKQSPVQCI